MFVMVEDFENLKMHVFNTACVKFYSGNYLIGYKVKYRYEYDKLDDILKITGLFTDNNPLSTGYKDEKYDPLWNKMCQRIIIMMLMLQKHL